MNNSRSFCFSKGKRMLCSIDYFYYDSTRNVLILGSKGRMYAQKGKAEDLLTMLCEANGRNLQGSISLFQKCNNAHQKAAVLVNPHLQEIYFPTHAGSNEDCIWINYGKVEKLTALSTRSCRIDFVLGGSICVKCSRKVIRKQMQRCDHLLKSLYNPYETLSETAIMI